MTTFSLKSVGTLTIDCVLGPKEAKGGQSSEVDFVEQAPDIDGALGFQVDEGVGGADALVCVAGEERLLQVDAIDSQRIDVALHCQPSFEGLFPCQ